MQLRNSSTNYGAISRLVHWAVVALVLVGWLLGTFGEELPRGTARAAALFVHISAGLCVLVALAARLIWRILDPPPPPEPTSLGIWAERAGLLTHYLLYILLAAVPLAGIAVQFLRGDPLPVFGVFDVASPWAADRSWARQAKGIHELLANALVGLAALHAAAALFHHWILRDRTLARMTPGITR
jgi:cytochrome b561